MSEKLVVKEHFQPRFDLLFATCCTNLSVEEATQRMNEVHPAGTKRGWKLADEEDWPECLTENPWACPDNQEHKHMYFTC